MNIKECKRNLMIVKDIDSDVISEAYFILKSGVGLAYESRVSEEAERIIRECGAESRKKRRISGAALLRIVAAVGIIAAVSIAVFIFTCIKI